VISKFIATSTQLGWAQVNDVSLITANYMRPELGYTGNGFYNFGVVVSSIGIQTGSGGYIHSVYSVTGGKSQRKNQNAEDGKPLVRDIQMESQDLIGWASVPVPQSNKEPSTIQVCHGEEFCCILTYRTIRSAEKANYQVRIQIQKTCVILLNQKEDLTKNVYDCSSNVLANCLRGKQN
jgi:hypothetical protein